MNRKRNAVTKLDSLQKPSHGDGWALIVKRTVIAPLLATLLLTVFTGCGPKNYLNDNDTLRKENLELKRQVETLSQSLELRIKQIEQNEKPVAAAATQPALAAVSKGDIPRVIAIKFDDYSGPIDTNADNIEDTLRVYVLTSDQRGRFLPAVGQMVLQVVTISPEKGATEIAKKIYTPREFEETYRTGLTGTHYTLELPLPVNLGKGEHAVTVKISFTDANSGQTLEQEQAMKIRQ